MRAPPRFRSVALGVAWRNLHNFFTNPALLLPALLFPLFFFTAFAGGLSRIDQAPGFDYPPATRPSSSPSCSCRRRPSAASSPASRSRATSSRGFGRRLMLAAPNRRAIVAGYALVGASPRAVRRGRAFAIALVIGMEVQGDGVDLFGLIGLALLRQRGGR